MTQQQLFDRLMAYKPEGMNLSVDYQLSSWKGFEWIATFSHEDPKKGMSVWADTPEELLTRMFMRLDQRKQEAT